MAYENFTTYTEFDEGADVTVDSATKVSWVNLHSRSETAYLYKDKGANHFDGDFTHKFEIQFSNIGSTGWASNWMVANMVGDVQDIINASEDTLLFSSYNNIETLFLRAYDNGAFGANDSWASPGPQPSTTYYVEVVRDDNGGANNTGRITAYIRIGSHSGALQDTLVIDCAVGEQNDFRYIYALATFDTSGTTITIDGFTQNLDIGEPVDLSANNIESSSQVTAFSFNDHFRGLNAEDVQCLSQVTAGWLGVGWLSPPDEMPCDTQITVPSFDVVHALTIPNIESLSEVDPADLHRSFDLDASDVSSLTEVTAAAIYKELLPSDIECSSEVEAADLEWIKILKLNATLPMITAEMTGGQGGFLNVELPMITAEMRAGARLNVTLPMITAELEGKVGVKADLNVTLPMITAEMTGKVEVLGQLNVTLPMITARMTGAAGQVGQLNVTLPMITAALTGYTDIDGQLNVTLPMIEARLVGTVEREACPVLRYSEPELE